MSMFTLSRQLFWRTIPRFTSQDRVIDSLVFHSWRIRWGWWAFSICHSYSDLETGEQRDLFV